ncbi:MAG: hypothetical protein EOP48_23035 [Sphingobacteriales bacterium]|nr:MAG: hypothetical protein EOP48_23035 [Sphingobacteriales bacterium]
MNSLKIYWTGIEYNYSNTSPQFGKLAGGFVYGFVKALDATEALNKFKDELTHQHIDVKEVEFISPYDIEMEWETEEQANRYIQLYREAESLNQVVLDDFYAFENEE